MTIHAATLSTIRQQIARIPAGPGRSADEYVEDLRRTLDCMEVAETIDAERELVGVRTGAYYRNGLGEIIGPIIKGDNDIWPFEANGSSYQPDGSHGYRRPKGHPLDLIAEVTAPNTICTPIVPVTIGRNTQIVDPDTGCLTELGVGLLNDRDAQIAELRKMIEREVG